MSMSSQTDMRNQVDVNRAQAELKDLQRALNTVPAIFQQVGDLKDRVSDIESESTSDEPLDDMQENISDIEDKLESIHTISQDRIQSIETQQEELRSRIEALESDQNETLESRVEALEGLFTPHALGKQQAHNEAQSRGVEQVLDIGETRKVVIEETLLDRPNPQFKTTISGVVTFVDIENRDMAKGDTVEVKIYDLCDTVARAKPINNFN